MKNFKKIIILSITILVMVVYFIYDYLSNDVSEVVEENIFIEEDAETVEINTIILHITGEVNSPRSYRNRRRFKIS